MTHLAAVTTQSALVILCFALIGKPALAQQVGAIDLTHAKVPESIKPTETTSNTDMKECDSSSFTIADGEISEGGEKQKLTLVLLSLNKDTVSHGETIGVQVALHNVGRKPVQIAWSSQPLASLSDYEVGSFTLWLAGKPLESHVSLWGSDTVPGSLLKISPGEWARIDFNATVKCSLTPCEPIQPADSAVAKVSWRQYLSTWKREGCAVTQGAYTRYKVRSNELKVKIMSSTAVGSSPESPH
jgi:hypothetical protein